MPPCLWRITSCSACCIIACRTSTAREDRLSPSAAIVGSSCAWPELVCFSNLTCCDGGYSRSAQFSRGPTLHPRAGLSHGEATPYAGVVFVILAQGHLNSSEIASRSPTVRTALETEVPLDLPRQEGVAEVEAVSPAYLLVTQRRIEDVSHPITKNIRR